MLELLLILYKYFYYPKYAKDLFQQWKKLVALIPIYAGTSEGQLHNF